MSDRSTLRDRGVVGTLLRTGLLLGLSLMAAGLVLALMEGRLDAHAVDLTQIPAMLEHGRPSALMATGAFVLLVTPIARVLAMVVLFARERDRLFAAVATAVACLLALGIVLGRL